MEENKKIEENKEMETLTDEQLELVNGGTTYGTGYDGISRTIVLKDHNACKLYKSVEWYVSGGTWEMCCDCKWYSYNTAKKRITAVSGWCTHEYRKKENDKKWNHKTGEWKG